MGAPLLIGAGVGALGSAVMGGNPLKGALLGGATGGLAGGASSLLGGGSFLEGAGLSGLGAAAPVSTAVIPTTASEFEAAMGLPNSAFIESGGSLGTALGGRTAAMAIPPVASDGIMSGMWDSMKPYVTPSNVIGAANIAAQYQPKQYQINTGGGGGVVKSQFTPHTSQLSTGDLLLRKKSNPFLLG